jgi:antirestriction protein ArdC
MPSVYEIVTGKIIKQLESGVAPWRKPWTCQTPANLLTQNEYRGLNVLKSPRPFCRKRAPTIPSKRARTS